MNERTYFKNLDWPLITLFLTLVFAGWLNIYAAVYDEAHASMFDVSQRYGKQMIFIVTALVIALVVLLMNAHFFQDFAYPIYGIALILLVAVLIAGVKISGARSWFQLGTLSIQPSEIAKFATCLALARYLSTSEINLKRWSTRLMTFGLILLPPALILLQPDMGSAMVYVCFIVVLFREGFPSWMLWSGILAILLFVLSLVMNIYILLGLIALSVMILLYVNKKTVRNILSSVLIFICCAGFAYSSDMLFQRLEPHQKDRIDVLLGKEVDLRGVGYNVNQSKIAIGSGGFLGKGYLQGTQTKFNFVPEQSTDFIFCTVGEEWGFVGSIVILGLFATMILRIIYLAERQRNSFGRIYGYGLAMILFFHVFVNVGMALGLLPVIGIPLPFFSYGGSSLWAFTLLLFVFIRVNANRLSF